MERLFVTGDRHGRFDDLLEFCEKAETTKRDILIIAGDVGINYYVRNNPDYVPEPCDENHGVRNCPYANSKKILKIKEYLEQLPITLFCIHGNHEARPETINTYRTKMWHGGEVYYEEEYPDLIFAKDGETYDFNGKKCLVIGGAYSVDKFYRLIRYNAGEKQYKWFADEQPSEETKQKIIENITDESEFDYIFSHTCPLKYEPVEVFLSGIDQSKVDKSTEEFLDVIENRLHGKYKKWYCGHYHTEKIVDSLEFLFYTIKEVATAE